MSSYTYTLSNDLSAKISSNDWFRVKASVTNDRRPLFLVNQLYVHSDFNELQFHKSSRDICDVPNAGGASEKSEALSFELLNRTFGARLLKTEMEIEYDWCISKRTDFLVVMFGKRLGISVTRAMKFNPYRFREHRATQHMLGEEHYRFTYEDARSLLQKKLYGVIMSTRDVIERDSWGQQLLHVWAADHETASVLAHAYADLRRENSRLLANTIVMVTVALRADWIFTNRAVQQQTALTDTVRRFHTLFPSRSIRRFVRKSIEAENATAMQLPMSDEEVEQHISFEESDDSLCLGLFDGEVYEQEETQTDEERYRKWNEKWAVRHNVDPIVALATKGPFITVAAPGIEAPPSFPSSPASGAISGKGKEGWPLQLDGKSELGELSCWGEKGPVEGGEHSVSDASVGFTLPLVSAVYDNEPFAIESNIKVVPAISRRFKQASRPSLRLQHLLRTNHDRRSQGVKRVAKGFRTSRCRA